MADFCGECHPDFIICRPPSRERRYVGWVYTEAWSRYAPRGYQAYRFENGKIYALGYRDSIKEIREMIRADRAEVLLDPLAIETKQPQQKVCYGY